ncbi:MAG: hypothetical protein AB1641_05335 [Thermodesulfobacteriota bacterium]
MSGNNLEDKWVWVIVENLAGQETYYALTEETGKNLKFIPAFENQDEAEACGRLMAKRPEAEYQVQAIRLTHLAEAAARSRSDVYILDGRGRILERLTPAAG